MIPVRLPPRLSRLLLAALLILAPALARAETQIPELKALTDAGMKVSALFSVDGKQVAAISPDVRINPASVTKLFTAALALKTLGPDHRLKTVVYRTADGALVIEGAGDPELTLTHLDELAACVASKDPGRTWSKVIFSTGPFDRQDLPPAYDQKSTTSAYRASVAGLQINRNAVAVSIGKAKPGQQPAVKVTPMSDYIRVRNSAVAAAVGKAGTQQRKKDPLRIETSQDADGRMVISISGKARPGKSSGYTFRVENPAWNAAAAFVASLTKRKVAVRAQVPDRGQVPAGAEKICFRPSHTVREIIVPMLKDSINPVAESVLRLVGAQDSGKQVGFAEGAARMRDFMVHDVLAPPESFVITNGSGLYGANSVSASAVVGLIDWILKNPQIKSNIRLALPVGGIDGTLSSRFTSEMLKGRVFAKTGTLDEAISLAGWVELQNGHNLAFAVLVQGDSKLEAGRVRNAIDASVARMARAVSAP